MCHCETSDRSHWLWQSVTPVLSAPLPKGGWRGEAVTGGFVPSPHRADRAVCPYKEFRRGRWSCCGAQNFCAALRRTLEILTAATRSLRFLCHWQRSVRSPHRPDRLFPAPPAGHTGPALQNVWGTHVSRCNRGIRNTPVQIQRRTDCHSRRTRRLRNDTVNKRCGISPGGPM